MRGPDNSSSAIVQGPGLAGVIGEFEIDTDCIAEMLLVECINALFAEITLSEPFPVEAVDLRVGVDVINPLDVTHQMVS